MNWKQLAHQWLIDTDRKGVLIRDREVAILVAIWGSLLNEGARPRIRIERICLKAFLTGTSCQALAENIRAI